MILGNLFSSSRAVKLKCDGDTNKKGSFFRVGYLKKKDGPKKLAESIKLVLY